MNGPPRPLLVCRPQPGADATARRAREQGLAALVYPLFRVEPLRWSPPDATGFDALVLTSANALRHGGADLSRYHALPVFAVGEATAQMARQHGFRAVTIAGPDRLALFAALARTGHRHVLHLCGEEAPTGDAGPVEVTRRIVYRSAEAGDAAGMDAMLDQGPVLMAHSPRAGARIAALVPAHRRGKLDIIAISAAAADAAGPGWRTVPVAPDPTDSAMLALALQICQGRPTNFSHAAPRTYMSSDIPGQADPSVDPAPSATPSPAPAALSSSGPSPSTPLPTPPARAPRGWLILLLVLIAFGGGIAAALWAVPRAQLWWNGETSEEQAVTEGPIARPPEDRAVRAPERIAALPGEGTSLSIAALEARLASLSARMDGISEQASAAAGNAARAEGLLIAFATRRALDQGAPLGYLEGELRLRFADSQPRAVATIINAAHAPVTIADLQYGLEEAAPGLTGTGGGKSDWWEATRRELANLIIIRKADAPSPVPQRVLERAKLLISAGRVSSALQEVERLPDHEKADNWVQMARKYNEARRALDVIEAAAILEPRIITRNSGGGTMQVAPPPPVTPPLSNGGEAGNSAAAIP
ncbi:MAG: uroporphyrinogen-III synthase [Sphingobium sp.]